MTKLIAVLTAAVLAIFGLGALTPASATDYQWQETNCHTQPILGPANNFTVCMTVGYRRQDDGDGLRAEDMWIDVNRGCSTLEANQPFDYMNVGTAANNAVNLGPGYSCHLYRDVEVKGPDVGAMVFFLKLQESANNYPDGYDIWQPHLCPNNAC